MNVSGHGAAGFTVFINALAGNCGKLSELWKAKWYENLCRKLQHSN